MGSIDHTTHDKVMRIKEIRVYPIKSIRGVSLPSHTLTTTGFEYDRIFMLNRASDNRNMHVPHFPSMCLFTTSLSPSPEPATSTSAASVPDTIQVRFGLDHTFDQPDQKLPKDDETLSIPIRPDISQLETAEYKLHSTVTRAYIMPAHINKWFSDRFGFDVRLHYIGHPAQTRQVLGALNPHSPRIFVGDPDPKVAAAKQLAPNSSNSWLNSIKTSAGALVNTVASYTTTTATDNASGTDQIPVEEGLTFADIAAFLVVSQESFEDAQQRVGEDVDMEKFRPNIVVEGAQQAWEEDYWGAIAIRPAQSRDVTQSGDSREELNIVFTSNCMRCASINVDYKTGRMGTGPSGQLLKKLQSDRRVDPGHKYSPAFGRYGFVSRKNGEPVPEGRVVSVGDEVVVNVWNEKRTHFYWPGLGT